MSAHYKLAIDIIWRGNLDHRLILLELAKSHPKVFCDIVGTVGNVQTKDVERETKEVYTNSGFITAIKHHRALTGLGLKEAKEAVERITGCTYRGD